MTDLDKDEFWKALGRLNDSAMALQRIAESHEKRLDRLDVIVEWLAEEQRMRGKGALPRNL